MFNDGQGTEASVFQFDFTGIRGARRQAFVVGVSKREFCYR